MQSHDSIIPQKLIDFTEVRSRTGQMSKATYWRLRRAHSFPNPIAISARRKAWLESDINAWIASRTPNRPLETAKAVGLLERQSE